MASPEGRLRVTVLVLVTAVEWMAARPTAAAVLTVTSSVDESIVNGACSLREAILAANGGAAGDCGAGSPGIDLLRFSIAGSGTIPGSGVHQIALSLGALPTVVEPIDLDGSSQPPNGGVASSCVNGPLPIHLLALAAPAPGTPILDLASGAAGSRISGLRLSGPVIPAHDGIRLDGVDSVRVQCNHLDALATGLRIRGDASGNLVGTDGDGVTDADERNNFGNLDTGIRIETGASGNRVAGNYIGTGLDGATFSVNLHGVVIDGAHDNLVGADGDGIGEVAQRNLISGNGDRILRQGEGVLITGGSLRNRVAGNFIGTNAAGTGPLPNVHGVVIEAGSSDNVVGTNGDGIGDGFEGNLISNQDQPGPLPDGVRLQGALTRGNRVAGNIIGLAVTGAAIVGSAGRGVVIIDAPENLIGTDGDGVSDALERNVISGHTGAAIVVGDAADPTAGDGQRIAGNWIGTDLLGNTPRPNGAGIQVLGGQGHRIGTDGDGTSDLLERNVIASSTSYGIDLRSGGHVVAGNHLGTDPTGYLVRFNATAQVRVGSSADGLPVTVGSDDDSPVNFAEGNLIVGSAGAAGILIEGGSNHRLVGNTVGATAGGDARMNTVPGVRLATGTAALVHHNRILFSNGTGLDLQGTATLLQSPVPSSQNCIVQNTAGVVAATPTPVFENNWWGAADGPSPGGSGDSASGVDASPFLTAPPAGMSCRLRSAATADLSVTKTDGLTVVTPGSTITYTIDVFNGSTSTANGARVQDSFPPTLTGVSWTCAPNGTAGGTCDTSSGTGDIDHLVNLPFNRRVRFTVTATVAPTATGVLTNQVVVRPPDGVNDQTGNQNSAVDRTLIDARADLRITKSDGGAVAVPGGDVTYTLVVGNDGPAAVLGARVGDALPAGVVAATWTCAAAGGAVCSGGPVAGAILDTVDLPVGGTATYTLIATVAAAAVGVIENHAAVDPPIGVVDPDPADNAVVETTPILTDDLRLTKSDGVTSATPGGSVTYVIEATNGGTTDALGALVDDVFPGVLDCSWTCAGTGGGVCPAGGVGDIAATVNLPAGAAVAFTATCSIDPAATGTLSNTARLTPPSGFPDGNAANNEATDVDTLVPRADLVITKSNGVTSVTAGLPIAYAVTVTNPGPSDAVGALVADTFPADLVGATWTCAATPLSSCTAGPVSASIADTATIRAGGTLTYTVNGSVAASATGTLSNTATVAAPAGTDDLGGANSATDADPIVERADIVVSLDDGTTVAVPGSTVTYALRVENPGPGPAAGVRVTTGFPATLSCSTTCSGTGGGVCAAGPVLGNLDELADLPVGGAALYSAVCDIASAATGVLIATARAESGGEFVDPSPENDDAMDQDTLEPRADLTVAKSDGVATAVPGQAVTYTVIVSNAGPSDAPASRVLDAVPAVLDCSWTCSPGVGSSCPAGALTSALDALVDLAVGAAVTLTGNCAIDSAASGNLVNTASVAPASGVIDPDPSAASNTATDTDLLVATGDVTLTKSNGVAEVVAGTTVNYLLTVNNPGPSDLVGVIVEDTPPASLACTWLCSSSGGGICGPGPFAGNLSAPVDIPAGGAVEFAASCDLDSAASGTLTNTADLRLPPGFVDPVPTNAASDTDTVTRRANLSITKTDGAAAVLPGSAVAYSVVAANAGPSDAPGALLADSVPAQLGSVTWTCTGSGGATCSPGGAGSVAETVSLPAGASVTLLLSGTLTSAFLGTVENTATIAVPAGVTEAAPGDESATDQTLVSSAASVTATKVATSVDFRVGSTVVYEIVLTNHGPAPQLDNPGPEFTDSVPGGLEIQSISATSGTVQRTGNDVSWDGTIGVAGTVTIRIEARLLPAPIGTRIENQGMALYDGDGNGDNEAQQATDDPASPGPANPTAFTVAGSVVEIPAVQPAGLAVFALALGLWAWRRVRRTEPGPRR